MATTLGWGDIALRLALTVLAGALLGLDRSEYGRPAGLRTTLLVTLAASIAMLLANRLLGTVGRPSDSFIRLDLMRLPLGILTGVGFIGAGAIVHRDDLVLGVTTAATLWFATVIGLCLGGGELALGVVGLALGVATLSGLRRLEGRLPQRRYATLTMAVQADFDIAEAEIRARLSAIGYRLGAPTTASFDAAHGSREYCWDVRWTGSGGDEPVPAFVDELTRRPGVLALTWQPTGRAKS